MNRTQITVVGVGALVFSIFVVTGTLATQTADLADAGYAPTHIATCQVRLSSECVQRAADVGVSLRTYERARFPVSMRTLSDGGRDVQMPPLALGATRRCVEVVDWADCTLATAASAPAVANLWGTQVPFTIAGTTKKCVRAKLDAGLNCARLQSDGGVYSFGDRNVFLRSEAAAPATCESVECGPIMLGEEPEADL